MSEATFVPNQSESERNKLLKIDGTLSAKRMLHNNMFFELDVINPNKVRKYES